MSKVLLAWELGAGAGHWTNLYPIALHLEQQGHNVWVALRDVAVAKGVAQTSFSILQAPCSMAKPNLPIDPQRTFAHILHNCGYADQSTLHSLIAAWRGLFDLTRPDLLICEHAPTALFASRGLKMKRIAIGAGFNSPPDVSPLPDMQSWLPPAEAQNLAVEEVLLTRMNQVLDCWRAPPLERVSKLFHEIDQILFVTFPELDHYGCRADATYWGMWFAEGTGAPVWPPGKGPRIFVYTYPFPGIENLLSLLSDLGVRALVNIPGFGPEQWRRLQFPNVQFLAQRLDIHELASGSDAAILNGSNGAATAMLLGGTPVFNIPRWAEQVVYAHRIDQMGAGLSALPSRPERIGSRLVTLLNEPRFTDAARQFAAKYADYSAKQTLCNVIAQIERQLS